MAKAGEGLVQAMGLAGRPRSLVSEMTKELDQVVDGFRNRTLAQGHHARLWLDAISQRCRQGGRVVNLATLISMAANAQGQREVSGVEVVTGGDGAGWTGARRRGGRLPQPSRHRQAGGRGAGRAEG